jgi:hypothetical protein
LWKALTAEFARQEQRAQKYPQYVDTLLRERRSVIGKMLRTHELRKTIEGEKTPPKLRTELSALIDEIEVFSPKRPHPDDVHSVSDEWKYLLFGDR